MMRAMTSLSVYLLVLSVLSVNCEPIPISSGTTIPIVRRSRDRTGANSEDWAQRNRNHVISKYAGGNDRVRRGSGMNLLTNQAVDGDYFGTIAVGTPPIAYNVILDTGSSDLWIASSSCTIGCTDPEGGVIPTFNSHLSSTFKNTGNSFNVHYGSGAASGVTVQDVVQMAGFQVKNQAFGLCDQVQGILSPPLSGLMGLAWSGLASQLTTPFWQTLASANAWSEPVMSFQLTRFNNATNVESLEPGGQFTMGFLNQSLYTGMIDYQNVPSDRLLYWTIPMTSLTVQGKMISPSPGEQYAAIDTGTTLIGGPPDAVSQIYANIPGSEPGTGGYTGYYLYPCSTKVNVTISFGGPAWPISSADFQHAALQDGSGKCIGAFFQIPTGTGVPSWIIGDSFLKNVYSVFRFSPPSVGFAALSSVATGMNGVQAPIPTATIGEPGTAVTATGISLRNDASGPSIGVWSLLPFGSGIETN
ncbi:acid protease [Gloeophyllum trabeum ATCC 11539]|uniref:Acid protease n=1 Tax=Gloeophyllum trabeum (strain ATCC 11539 / FP-39264 / Madison 617) TaxID=670483 RepID=S7RI15_GLOTA|nr:acid protease [Gloeophyllum trabeum ATCC 11539]EPQ53925.1 acid protease [Gloeophyllum trabeum ATCC 11539]